MRSTAFNEWMPAGNSSVSAALFATSDTAPIHDVPSMKVTVPAIGGPDKVAVSVNGVCVSTAGFDVVSAIGGAAPNFAITAAGPKVLDVWKAPVVAWKLLPESASPVTYAPVESTETPLAAPGGNRVQWLSLSLNPVRMNVDQSSDPPEMLSLATNAESSLSCCFLGAAESISGNV